MDLENCKFVLIRTLQILTDFWLEYGFCFVDGCPVSPDKTQELLERIAFVRVTHYGETVLYSCK